MLLADFRNESTTDSIATLDKETGSLKYQIRVFKEITAEFVRYPDAFQFFSRKIKNSYLFEIIGFTLCGPKLQTLTITVDNISTRKPQINITCGESFLRTEVQHNAKNYIDLQLDIIKGNLAQEENDVSAP